MSKNKKNLKILPNVTITDIGEGGKAIGRRPEGEVVLVNMAVPGDVVNVKVGRKRKGLYQGEIHHFLNYSPDRVEPFCSHFWDCGGCTLQQLNYSKQLYYKERVVQNALQRIGKLKDPNVLPIIASASDRHYRNKMEFTFSALAWIPLNVIKKGEVVDRRALGFHPPRYFDRVVDIQTCYLMDAQADVIRNQLRQFCLEHHLEFYNQKTHTGFIRNIILRRGIYTDEWMAVMIFNYEDDKLITLIMDFLQEQFNFHSLGYYINAKTNDSILDLEYQPYAGESFIQEQISHLTFRIGAKSFFQTNSMQARVMFDTVKNLLQLTGQEVVYDLYCGAGSIGLYLAHACREVVGIEVVPEAILEAKINAGIKGLTNATFYEGDVRDVFTPQLVHQHGAPDVIIVDPPRAGLHPDMIKNLIEIHAPRIVYVSCNVATQSRDLALLTEQYQAVIHQPLDMFPHTHHTENITLLIKKQKTNE